MWVNAEGRRVITDFAEGAELPQVWMDRRQILCSFIEAQTPDIQMNACVLVAAAWYVQPRLGLVLYLNLPGIAKAAQLSTCRC